MLRFADWPDGRVPRRAAGVYTVWRGAEFLYAGMSGRGAQREDFVAQPGQRAAAMGLWTRLNSHASGRRSGDQFNIYVCDRFVVPALTAGQQRQVADGRLLLDQLTRDEFRPLGAGLPAATVGCTQQPARPRRGRAVGRPWFCPAIPAGWNRIS